jgi:hypothetical protein
MRKSRILSKAIPILVAVLFTLIFAHRSSQVASAALPAPSPERTSATGIPEPQQYPVMDQIANKIIAKYQGATCEQLWVQKSKPQPKSTQEQEIVGILHQDAQMRAAFINKVAPPVVNKMFDCGMIP